MRYFLVREDQALPEVAENLINNNNFFSSKQLITMNALASIECTKGNLDLNLSMMSATECLAKLEKKHIIKTLVDNV